MFGPGKNRSNIFSALAGRRLLCVLCFSAVSAESGRVLAQGLEIKTFNGASDVPRLTFESGAATEEAYFMNVNLGIGTQTPGGYRLVLKEAASAGGNGMQIVNLAGDKSAQFWVGTGGAVFDAEGTTNLHLRTGGTDRIIIVNATGYVGIGAAVPTRQLDTTGNVKLNNVFIGDVGHGATWAGFSHNSIPGTGTYGLLQSSDANYTLVNKGSGAGWIGFRVNNADMMVVRETGNVGIGTTAPPTKLCVVGSAYVATAMSDAGEISIKDSAPQINFDDTDNNHWAIHVNSNKMYFIREPWNFSDLVLDGAGNIGIGDSAPADKLCLHGALRMNDSQIYFRGHADPNHGISYQAGPPDGLQVYGYNGVAIEDRNGGTTRLATFDTGGMKVDVSNRIEANSGSGTVRLRDADTGKNLYMDNDGLGLRVYQTGPIVGKNFIIDHPTDAEKYLIHACIEGPEAAVFYRGTARLKDGEAEIVLPAYFEALTREEGRTVQLTAEFETLEEPVSRLAHSKVRDGKFRVRAIDGRNPGQAFSWEVKATRKDVSPLLVEPRKDEVDVRGFGPYTYYTVKNQTPAAVTGAGGER